MNTEQTRNAVDVMLAWANGATVQYKKIVGDTDGWVHCDYPGWNWDKWHYRIKPQPVEVVVFAIVKDGKPITTSLSESNALEYADRHRAIVVPAKGTYTCDT